MPWRTCRMWTSSNRRPPVTAASQQISSRKALYSGRGSMSNHSTLSWIPLLTQVPNLAVGPSGVNLWPGGIGYMLYCCQVSELCLLVDDVDLLAVNDGKPKGLSNCCFCSHNGTIHKSIIPIVNFDQDPSSARKSCHPRLQSFCE